MSIATDNATYCHVLGHYTSGVSAVMAAGRSGEPLGMIVGSFSSASLNPPPDRILSR